MKIIATLLLILLLQCCSNNNKNRSLIGSWSFVADQLLDSTNNVIRQDTSVAGLLLYMPDGKMSVQFLWKGGRASMLNDTLMKQDGASAVLGLGFNTWTGAQARKLIDTYDAYFGNYMVNWNTNTITHIMTGNLRPEKEKTVYKRIFRIAGDSLFLRSTDPASRWQVACARNKQP